MSELKPCPFCSEQPSFSRIPGGGFSVLCPGCGAIAVLGSSSGQAALATAWNRRTPRFSGSAVKPCPFCGSSAALGKMARDPSILVCNNCGLMLSYARSGDADTSVAYWNHRA